jgi:hypothetical protein
LYFYRVYVFVQVSSNSQHSFSCPVCLQLTHVTGHSFNLLLADKMITAQDIVQYDIDDSESHNDSDSANEDNSSSQPFRRDGFVRRMNGLSSTMYTRSHKQSKKICPIAAYHLHELDCNMSK